MQNFFEGNVLRCPFGCEELTINNVDIEEDRLFVNFFCDKHPKLDDIIGVSVTSHTLRIWSSDGVTHCAWENLK